MKKIKLLVPFVLFLCLPKETRPSLKVFLTRKKTTKTEPPKTIPAGIGVCGACRNDKSCSLGGACDEYKKSIEEHEPGFCKHCDDYVPFVTIHSKNCSLKKNRN